MDKHDWLAEEFESHREHLRAVAYWMLGSLTEADDAVQTSWLNFSRSDTDKVENLGWMTTIVAHVCLDMLRSRKSRHESASASPVFDEIRSDEQGIDPEHEAQLADSVGLALMVVLNTLAPDERLAFVLHDVFALPFDEIASIVGQSSTTTRQLANRARRRVRGVPTVPSVELVHQRDVVNAFLATARAGDFNALLAVLDPDVVLRSDAVKMPSGEPLEVHGAQRVAKMYGREGANGIRPALVNGAVGLVVAPRGRLMLIVNLTFKDGKIAAIDATGDPARLDQTDLAMLED